MKIKCYGARGSFPVCGEQYLRYGGETSCVSVTSGAGSAIILDAGTGIRSVGRQIIGELAKSPGQKKVIHLLFSHYHLDHIVGFVSFAPIYNKNVELNVYGATSAPTARGGAATAEEVLRGLMRAPYFPVDFNDLPAKISFHTIDSEPFAIGDFAVTPIVLNHPNGGRGYKICEGDKTFVFMTDNELRYGKSDFDSAYFEKMCANADLLMHDGEYTDEDYKRYETWGHSKYTDAIKLAIAANVKRLALFHINGSRIDEGMDVIVADAKKVLQKNNSDIECYGVGRGFEIDI